MKTLAVTAAFTVLIAVALFNATIAFSTKQYYVLGGLAGFPMIVSGLMTLLAQENRFFVAVKVGWDKNAPVDYITEGHRFR